jgi:hypothetical protein
MKEFFLTTHICKLKIEIDISSGMSLSIIDNLPLYGEAKNIGGEIFYIVDLDIPFDGTEKEIFEVGDIVYWRSKKERKFAIAIFYGNTKFGAGNAPTAAGPCMKFGEIKGDLSALERVETGTKIGLEFTAVN